jgi:small subunit ribosomal protein S7
MRGTKAKKRIIESDPVYKSKVITRFINYLMLDGKKAISRSTVYSVLEELDEDKKVAAQKFEDAIKNVMPKQEVRSRRVGGATYQVPVPLKHERSEALAMRWMIDAARKRKGVPLRKKVLDEFVTALNNEGTAIKKKEDVHKMAEANKAFAHFKW